MEPGPPLPPPSASGRRNPWKVFGLLVIALVVIGGAVGIGFLLAGGSSDDAESTTTVPQTTAQPATTASPGQPTTTADTLQALDIDGDDGRLSQLEYEQALAVLRSEAGLSSSQLEGLNRTTMEGSGEAFCASLDYFQDISDAREDYRQFLATDMSAEMVDRAMSVAAVASFQMCSSLIESLS